MNEPGALTADSSSLECAATGWPRPHPLGRQLTQERALVRRRLEGLHASVPATATELLRALDASVASIPTAATLSPVEALKARRLLVRLLAVALPLERQVRDGRALATRAHQQRTAALRQALPEVSARLAALPSQPARDPAAIARQLRVAHALSAMARAEEALRAIEREARSERQQRLAELLRPSAKTRRAGK